MYVGRSIQLKSPINTSLPRDARVCVCAADIQAEHRTFLFPPDPALVPRRQPSSAGHDDLQISHPISLPHFLPHLLPSPSAIYAPVPLWANGRRSDYTVRPRRFWQARTRVPARYSILVSVSRCGVQHGRSLGQRGLRPLPRSQGDLVLDLRADMTGNVGLACVSLAHDCMRAWGSRDVAPILTPQGFRACVGRTLSGPTPTTVDTHGIRYGAAQDAAGVRASGASLAWAHRDINIR